MFHRLMITLMETFYSTTSDELCIIINIAVSNHFDDINWDLLKVYFLKL